MLAISAIKRYESIMPDFERFCDVVSEPLPTTFWVNLCRISSQALIDHGLFAVSELQELSWREDAYRFRPHKGLGNRLAYHAGFIHIQEEVAMIPAYLLGARPNERLLDLCAAPGNKSLQLAVQSSDKATIVANDVSGSRLKVTGLQVGRLGLNSLVLSQQNGLWFEASASSFDRILVDAPCSSEGTHRKNPTAFEHGLADGELFASGLQLGLLMKAAKLLRPGGCLVYSTCTYRPEENEWIVDRFLKRCPEMLVEPIELTGFRWQSGLNSWLDQSFDPAIKNCMRIWAHQNDSGGFFVAKMRRGNHA